MASKYSNFSFAFSNDPAQCQNLTVGIIGQGVPPYSILILPFGPTPLPGNIEARTIESHAFPGYSPSLSFKLAYPANSQFVAVVCPSIIC